MIIDELVDKVMAKAKGKRASWLAIGVSYAGVLSEGLGLAYVFREELGYSCNVNERAGELPRSMEELIEFAKSPSSLDSSLGVAAINSLLRPKRWEEGDLLSFLDIGKKDVVGMVGYFGPFIQKLSGKVKELYIFERGMQGMPFVYPDWAMELLLPKADVVIITGTSVINKTIDHILELSIDAREKAVVGPSTPLIPEPFKKRGVTLLSGILVEDVERVKEIVIEGGGTERIIRHSRKVTMPLS